MKKKGHFTMKKFWRYCYKTRKNKLAALLLIAVGLSTLILDKDATVLVFVSLISIPMFITDENWIS